MLTVDKSTTKETNTYFWDAKKERFGFGDDYLNHGFKATHTIIVDANLTAQELDIIFADVL